MQLASHEFAKRQLKGSQQSNNLASHYSPEILPFKINHDQSMPCRRDVAEITAKLLKLGPSEGARQTAPPTEVSRVPTSESLWADYSREHDDPLGHTMLAK